MPVFKADCHLHSCLSPCGDLDASPAAIVRAAARAGLDLVALTDHNSALNCPTFREAAESAGISALYGIEATTREEVHVLCLFESPEAALELGETVYQALPNIPVIPERYGDQVYVDIDDMILGEVDKHLIYAADYSIDELREMVTTAGGLFIPAHIDRAVNSIYSQLGFLPDAPYSAVEVTQSPSPIDTRGNPVISNSDAHFLEDVGSRTFTFEAEAPTFDGLRSALRRHTVWSSL
ncbi:MAG: PHP domain-containing protein [Spirochaetota bacterium]